jgi:hypothetical protein
VWLDEVAEVLNGSKNPGPEDPALRIADPWKGSGRNPLGKRRRKKIQAKPLNLTGPRGPGFLDLNKPFLIEKKRGTRTGWEIERYLFSISRKEGWIHDQ